MNIKCSLLALFLAGCMLPLAAQTPLLGLTEAYQAAEAHFPAVLAEKAGLAASQAQEKQVARKALPQASLQLQNTFGTFNASTGSVFPLAGVFNVSGNPDQENLATFNSYASLLADWEIFSFGHQRSQRAAAASGVQAAHYSISAFQLRLKSLISRLYINGLYQQSMLQQSRENTKRVENILLLARGLATAGLTPGADTALARSAFLQVRADLHLQTGLYQASKHQLNEYTGRSDTLYRFNPAGFSAQLFPVAGGSGEAGEPHPYLMKLQAKAEQQRHLGKAAGRAALPAVSLLGGLSARAGGQHAGSWRAGFNAPAQNYLLGLGLSWKVNKLADKRLEQKRIEAFQEQAEAELRQSRRQLQAAQRSADSQLRQQQLQLADASAAVQEAATAFRLYRKRYQTGLIKLSELLQIQHLLQQAQSAELEAFKAYWERSIERAETTGDFNPLFEPLNP